MLFVSYGLSNVYNIFVGFEIGVVYASENTDVAGMFCDVKGLFSPEAAAQTEVLLTTTAASLDSPLIIEFTISSEASCLTSVVVDVPLKDFDLEVVFFSSCS
ncbi:hypothetical protein DY000_02054079 [Brassica cretica]|nr:hypothetical protein DY000_02054079 [Brassica cretica]